MYNTNIPYFETLTSFYDAINVAKPLHEHFDVRQIEQNLKTVKMQMPSFRNSCFMISLTLKGQGSAHHAGTETFRVGDLSVFFTAPGQLQSWDVLPDWEGIYLIFTKEFFTVNRIILDEIRNSPFFDIDNRVTLTLMPQEAEVLLDLFQKINSEISTPFFNRFEFVKSYLRLMVMYLNRFYDARSLEKQKPEVQNANIKTIRDFQDLISDNLKAVKKLKTITEFAQKLAIHPNYLNALCKEILGKTASDLLQDSILLQAKSLILNSDFTMKEIAYQLGYDEPNYFFRFFKKHVGLTPLDFKKNSQL